MTKREFLQAIIGLEVATELKEFAQSEIAKLDKRNLVRASSNSSKKAQENKPLKDNILSVLNDGGLLASDIAELTGYSQQKVSALCRQMVDDGILLVSDRKVKGKGTRKFYEIVTE